MGTGERKEVHPCRGSVTFRRIVLRTSDEILTLVLDRREVDPEADPEVERVRGRLGAKTFDRRHGRSCRRQAGVGQRPRAGFILGHHGDLLALAGQQDLECPLAVVATARLRPGRGIPEIDLHFVHAEGFQADQPPADLLTEIQGLFSSLGSLRTCPAAGGSSAPRPDNPRKFPSRRRFFIDIPGRYLIILKESSLTLKRL